MSWCIPSPLTVDAAADLKQVTIYSPKYINILYGEEKKLNPSNSTRTSYSCKKS